MKRVSQCEEERSRSLYDGRKKLLTFLVECRIDLTNIGPPERTCE